MGQGGMILASVKPTGWRTPMECDARSLAALPMCGGGPKGGSKGSGPGGGGRGPSGAGGGNAKPRGNPGGKSPGRHRGKGDTPKGDRNYKGKHRDQDTRNRDARRQQKKDSRRQPQSERPQELGNRTTTEGGSQNTPGWDEIGENLSDPPEEYYDERTGGDRPRSRGPRKPMPDQQAPGREMPVE